jgi:hypothetical protein
MLAIESPAAVIKKCIDALLRTPLYCVSFVRMRTPRGPFIKDG